LSRKLETLVAYGDEPGPGLAQERGRAFEALVVALMRSHSLLFRSSYHTSDNRAEQIDGALELDGRFVLLESKWVKSDLAASDLFAFLGKVEGKFVGTIGLFVSYNQLTENFLSALRSGRRQSVLVVHGAEDIKTMFQPDFPLKGYLRWCIGSASTDNRSTVSPAQYLQHAARENEEPNGEGQPPAWKARVKALLENLNTSKNSKSLGTLTAGQPQEIIVENVEKIVQLYPRIVDKGIQLPPENLTAYLIVAANKMPGTVTTADTMLFQDVLPHALLDARIAPLTLALAPRLEVLAESQKSAFEATLRTKWAGAFGDWEDENALAAHTEPLWPYLSPEAKNDLMGYFLRILNSERRAGFAQWTCASNVVSNKVNERIVKDALARSLRTEFLSLPRQNDVPWARPLVSHAYQKLERFLGRHVFEPVLDQVAHELSA